MRALPAILAASMFVGVTGFVAGPASAHTPRFDADCDGVDLSATAYDGSKENRWSVTIDGVTTTGTFGADFQKTLPVPQDGSSTQWSAFIEAYDGAFRGQDAGTVGPCGEPQPADETRVQEGAAEGCDVVVQGTTYGPGEATWDELFTDTYVFDAATNTWVLVTDTTPEITNLDFNAWTVAQQVDEGCMTTAEQPKPEKEVRKKTRIDCDDEVRVITTITTITRYVYDEDTNTWELGEPETTRSTETVPVRSGDCDDSDVLGNNAGNNGGEPAGNAGQQPSGTQQGAPAPTAYTSAPATVPSAVDAGQASVAPTGFDAIGQGGAARTGGALALLAGLLVLVSAGALRRVRG